MAPKETELFIAEIYSLGAIQILIPSVDIFDADESRVEILVVKLPDDPATRKPLINHLNTINSRAGFDNSMDAGNSFFAIKPL